MLELRSPCEHCNKVLPADSNWKGDNWLGKYPAGTHARRRPVDAQAHAAFAAPIRHLPPQAR